MQFVRSALHGRDKTRQDNQASAAAAADDDPR